MERLKEHQTKQVQLIQVPGKWIPCSAVLPAPDANSENSKTTYDLLMPKKYSPDSDNHCIVPVMPAVPPPIDEKVLKEAIVEIRAPIKGTKRQYSDKTCRGYRSGSRSSLIPCRKVKISEQISSDDWVLATDTKRGYKYIADFEHFNSYVRAKGCGMWLDHAELPFPGIIMKEHRSTYAKEGEVTSEVRGVCFENTSCTEMLATEQIEENLNKVGLLCGNHSLGFWIYDKIENDVCPLITKTVSLFETVGDYRLENHLFPGLELLLSSEKYEKSAERFLDIVKPLYKNMEDKIPHVERTEKGEKVKNSPLYKRKNLYFTLELRKIIENDPSKFFNLDDFDVDGLSDDKFREAGFIPSHEIYKKIKELDEMGELDELDKSFVKLFKVFCRISFEVGRIISVVHRTGYLWGSFQDHSPAEFHVNAHPDNLVLLTKETCLSQKRRQCIAPVDFDMSHKKENSINFYKKVPLPDPTMVTCNMTAEITFMGDAIAGWYATYPISTVFKVRQRPPGKLYDALLQFRDCMYYEYLKGYEKINSDECEGNDISIDDMYDIIEEALNESYKFDS